MATLLLAAFAVLTLISTPVVHMQTDFELKEEYDVCNPETLFNDPPRAYLDQGETTKVYFKLGPGDPPSVMCEDIVFVTCPFCRIKVEKESPDFSVSECSSAHKDKCLPECMYLFLFDGDYKDAVNTTIGTSGKKRHMITESSKLHIRSCGDIGYHNIERIIKLKLTSIEKLKVFQAHHLPGNFVTSPYFPSTYRPNNEVYTYKFIGLSTPDFITINFDDWLLSPASEIELTGANIQGPIKGGTKRPYIVSNGSEMTMIFRTGYNAYTGLMKGFKGLITLHHGHETLPRPTTDCGEVMTGKPGLVITLGSDVTHGNNVDCIWVIVTPHGYDGSYLKVLNYSINQGQVNGMLEIRTGLDSQAFLSQYLLPSTRHVSYSPQISALGFYIRLRGSHVNSHDLQIAYTPYYSYCAHYMGEVFMCDNGRCIDNSLQCDDIDHCGDNSDETEAVCGHVTTPSSGNDVAVGTIITVLLNVLLVIVAVIIFILVRRSRKRGTSCTRRPPGSAVQNATGQCSPDRGHSLQMRVSSAESPPPYDAVSQSQCNMVYTGDEGDRVSLPPSYEEVVMGMPVANGSTTSWPP